MEFDVEKLSEEELIKEISTVKGWKYVSLTENNCTGYSLYDPNGRLYGTRRLGRYGAIVTWSLANSYNTPADERALPIPKWTTNLEEAFKLLDEIAETSDWSYSIFKTCIISSVSVGYRVMLKRDICPPNFEEDINSNNIVACQADSLQIAICKCYLKWSKRKETECLLL